MPQIDYIDHQQTAERIAGYFPGLDIKDLPGGEGWAIEQVNITTHNGTHLDAPWHYASTQDGGKPAMTIDEVPLEWCFGPGVKLDFRHFENGYVATAADVEAELKRIGHELKPLDIVVVNTAAGMRYGEDDYVPTGCGMGREATLYLTSRGVRVTGTDCVVVGRALCLHRQAVRRDRRCKHYLGGAQGRTRDWLLPHRKIAQSRKVAANRFHGFLLSGENS